MDKGHLCKAKRTDNGKWVMGNYIEDTATGKVYIYASGNLVKQGDRDGADEFLQMTVCNVTPSTVCHCTNKEYMNGVIAYEGDIFESQCSGDLMILRYGFYQAYCPVDEEYMETVGFYAECKGFPDMPIGDLQEYALKRGNIFDNPELIPYCCKQSEISVAASQS